MNIKQTLKPLFCISILGFVMHSFAYTDGDYKAKVETNDQYLTVVADTINNLCPQLMKDKKICKTEDPVGTALKMQEVMLNGESYIDEVSNNDLLKVATDIDAAFQFYDAVEQFKSFFDWKKQAGEAAESKDWETATLSEEMAWQVIVKTASRATFAASMLEDSK